MPKLTPLKIGIVASTLSVTMLVTELVWEPIFTVHFTESISIPLWILAAIYGGLQLFLWNMTRKGLDLTAEELALWGVKLEEVTPRILDDYRANKKVRDIARDIEASDGIPPDVTLRYIIALAKHAKQNKE